MLLRGVESKKYLHSTSNLYFWESSSTDSESKPPTKEKISSKIVHILILSSF